MLEAQSTQCRTELWRLLGLLLYAQGAQSSAYLGLLLLYLLLCLLLLLELLEDVERDSRLVVRYDCRVPLLSPELEHRPGRAVVRRCCVVEQPWRGRCCRGRHRPICRCVGHRAVVRTGRWWHCRRLCFEWLL